MTDDQPPLDNGPFIVAELSKSYFCGVPVDGTTFLAQLFERCLNTNHARGYHLHSWRLHRVMEDEVVLNETIIAIFERRPSE